MWILFALFILSSDLNDNQLSYRYERGTYSSLDECQNNYLAIKKSLSHIVYEESFCFHPGTIRYNNERK